MSEGGSFHRGWGPSDSYPALHSPDGHWWWNGWNWYPAYSVDRNLWWNGVSWEQVPRKPSVRRDLSPRLIRYGIIWLVLVGAWIPVLSSMAEKHASSSSLLTVGAALGSVAVLTTLVVGGRLAYLRLWREACWATLAGAGVLLFWYVAITLNGPDPGNQNDHVVGIGTIILAVPVIVAVALVLGIGAGVGLALRGLFKPVDGHPSSALQ